MATSAQPVLACPGGGVLAFYVAEVAKTSGESPSSSRSARILANSATAHAERVPSFCRLPRFLDKLERVLLA